MANEKNHATKPPHAARAAHALHCRIVTTQTAAGAPLALAVGTPLSPWGEWPLGPLGPRGPGLVGWAVPLAFVAALLLLAAAITRMALLPLAALLRGAERFGNDMDAPPLPERGPREIRTAVAAFNRMQQRIREHVRERTSMLGAIAHDLQTPLTRLRLRLEQVDDAALRERLADDLAECEVRVREGLDLARSLDDRAPLASVALDALLQSACDEAQDAGARVQAPAAASGLTVRARPQALLRCVENLIGNAVKYGGSAEVVAWRDGAHAVIAVRDHGPGIPPADLERVFEPFVRLEPSRSRETGGTGLGLAIVRNLMRAQRGSVSLRNRGADEGGGLEACLTIPLAAPPLAREASA